MYIERPNKLLKSDAPKGVAQSVWDVTFDPGILILSSLTVSP